MAIAGSGSLQIQFAAWGAASTNATGGSHRHERHSATAVVPIRTTPTKARVLMSGGASRSGGAARTAISPNEATIGESARIAMAAAATALSSAITRPSSTGIRP